MSTTMQQKRAWQGPVVLSYGFRPFFFGAGVLAALMIGLWTPWFLGVIRVPSALPPIEWHVHEMLFGYVPAVIAGFLLTAVPNWTGRLPVVGWPLGGLFALWLAGRVFVALSAGMPFALVGAAALLFPIALTLVIAREIVAGRNFRNLKVLVLLGAITLAQAGFHAELALTGSALVAPRLGIAATILLIMVIGGRIVPSFTRNWIKRENPGPEPKEFGTFDKIAMVIGGVALGGWVILAKLPILRLPVAGLLLVAGLIHGKRLLNWQPLRTGKEPLVWVLHLAYAFVPAGLILAGMSVWVDHALWHQAAVHAFTTGAIGLMTLAVMTRASRGHSGRPLSAPASTVAIYLLVFGAALARILAGFVPDHAVVLIGLSGGLWFLGYATFAFAYSAILLRPPLRG